MCIKGGYNKWNVPHTLTVWGESPLVFIGQKTQLLTIEQDRTSYLS